MNKFKNNQILLNNYPQILTDNQAIYWVKDPNWTHQLLYNGSFTLAKFVSEIIRDCNMRQSHKSHVTVTTVFALDTLGGAATNRNDPISVAK